MHKKVFPATLHSLHEMLAFVRSHFPATLKELESKIILATEEALVNIINYGYPHEDKGHIEIQCQEETTPQPGMTIRIKDFGIPFNPVKQAAKVRKEYKKLQKKSIDKLDYPLGGYGIYIYVGIMDRVEYQRAEGGNILSLTKYL